MKKRILRILCAALACVLLLGGAAAAADFPDTQSHWAKNYIDDLVERGYLNGYTDGTFKPDRNLSAAEAITLLSRFYTPDEYQQSEMDRLYGEEAAAAARKYGVSWAAKNLTVALGTGILTSRELADIALSSPIEKELLSVFMTRAMQLAEDAEALVSVTLAYTDVDDIAMENRCYIYVLTRIGVLTGNTSGTFSPHASVTRAIAAAMVSRAIGWLETNGSMPQVKGYEKTTSTNGIAVWCGDGTFRLMGSDGGVRVWETGENFALNIDGKPGQWKDDYKGCYAVAVITDETGKAASLSVDTGSAYKYGAVLYTQSTSSSRSITISRDGAIETVTIATSVPIYLDGVLSSLDKLPTGAFALLRVADGLADAVQVNSKPAEINGVITDLSYGDSAVFLIAGETSSYYCEVIPGNQPAVYRGTQSYDLTRLKKGDKVKVTLTAGVPTRIDITGSADAVEGQITKIETTSTAAGSVRYTLTVQLSTGVVKLFEAAGSTNVYDASGRTVGMQALAVGDLVNITSFDGEVVEISRTGTVATTSASVTGTVVSYNSSAGELTLNVDGVGWVYVKAATARVIVMTTGETSGLNALVAGTRITAYGTASDSYHYTANVVYILK